MRHRRWTTRCSEVHFPTSQIPQRPKKRFQSNSDSPISFSTLLFFISKRHKPKQKSGNAGCISRSYHIGRAKDKRFCLLMFSDYRWCLRSKKTVNHESIFERRHSVLPLTLLSLQHSSCFVIPGLVRFRFFKLLQQGAMSRQQILVPPVAIRKWLAAIDFRRLD